MIGAPRQQSGGCVFCCLPLLLLLLALLAFGLTLGATWVWSR